MSLATGAAVAIVSEDDTLTFADLEVGETTEFEDFLDEDIITRYTGATFDTDGRVEDITVTVGGNSYDYTKADKTVVPTP